MTLVHTICGRAIATMSPYHGTSAWIVQDHHHSSSTVVGSELGAIALMYAIADTVKATAR